MMTERRKMKKPENVWFLLGALAVLAMGIPYLILGKDAIFVYHDQLDGEVIAYLLQARHLWDGSGILPEFMNGASRTALTMPAPACVLLYRLRRRRLPACRWPGALSDMSECSSCFGGQRKIPKY